MTTARGFFSIIAAAACLAAGAWLYPRFNQPQQTQAANAATPVPAAPDDGLSGTLVPPAAVPVQSYVQALDVPLNSWVEKGEVIGEAEEDGDPDPAITVQTQLRLQRAQAAVRVARQRLLTAQPAQHPATLAFPQIEKEHEALRNDDRYRRKLETDLQHDETAAALNTSPVPESDPEAYRHNPRLALRRALVRERIAQAALLNLNKTPRIVSVVAPATGMLVQRENNPQAFDIVTGLDRLTVVAHVGNKRRSTIHESQPAVVYIPGQIGSLPATVASVGEPIPGPAGAPLYPVTLSVPNPAGLRPAGTAVTVVLETPDTQNAN